MSLSPENIAKLKSVWTINRRKYNTRKHVALLMGTHSSIGNNRDMRRIYHLVPRVMLMYCYCIWML
jgi:hypothetical protein